MIPGQNFQPNIVQFIKTTKGLNTKTQASRLLGTTGVDVELVACSNMVVSNTGVLASRLGYTKVLDGQFHSVFEAQGKLYLAEDLEFSTNLCTIDENLVKATIVPGLTKGLAIYFCEYKGIIYYSNSVDLGTIIDGVSVPWTRSSTFDRPIFLSGPLPGKFLTMYGGRMLMAHGVNLLYSYYWSPSLYNLTQDFITFESDIIGIHAFEQSCYIFTKQKVYFFDTFLPLERTPKEAYTRPTLPGSISKSIQGSLSPTKFEAILWASDTGLCIGDTTGQVINLTESTIEYPYKLSKGACCVQDQYVIHSVV
jgi:hypothetical protein